MPEEQPEGNQPMASPSSRNVPARLFRWLDKRTGVHELMHESLDEPIPGGARLAYVFGSGLLYIFISQIITGLCLALYYVPSAETAHTSVAYITKQVAAGAFLRSLHYYGSSAMIIVLALHFLQTFLYGSFKGRRELLWASGAVLSFLVLGMGFTGYLLPWDQKAYFATAVGTNIVGQIPLLGNWLTRLLRGGDTIGTLTLSRFYVAHVFLIPACIFAFIGAHILLFRKAGPAGPMEEDPVTPKLAPEGFYPRQVLMDMTFALLIMVGLGILAYFHPVGLGPIANAANTQFLPRPDWYYLPFFEWLKFWEGPKVVFAVVVIPGLLALAFFLMPFLDRNLERRPWRRPIPVLSVAIVMIGIVYLGVKSEHDDKNDPGVRAQLALQDRQEKTYSAAPFKPYEESPGGTVATVAAGPANPVVAHGRSLFEAHGCVGCHGPAGVGGIAPTLIGIATKLPGAELTTLLQHPNAAMNAGHMPPVDMTGTDLAALTAYLGALGTPAAEAPAGPTENAAEAPDALKAVGQAPSGKASPAGTARVDAQHASGLTSAGKDIFAQRGCAACHGSAGVGGRLPTMSSLIAGQSDAQLLQVIKLPNAKMKAGGMQPVTGTAAELTSVVAYLHTLGSAPPAKGTKAPAVAEIAVAPSSPPSASIPITPPATVPQAAGAPAVAAAVVRPNAGHAVFISQGCAACHGVDAGGTHFAPALIGVSAKFPDAALPDLLHHPTAKMKAGGMPPVTANPADVKQLVSYIRSLDIAPTPSVPSSTPSLAAAGEGQPAPSNGAAPKGPNSTPVQQSAAVVAPKSPLIAHGQQVFQHFSCETCHGAGGLHGTAAAPGLAGTASMLPAATLSNLLRHHSTQMINGNMPPTNMNAQDMKSVIAYIRAMPSAPETP